MTNSVAKFTGTSAAGEGTVVTLFLEPHAKKVIINREKSKVKNPVVLMTEVDILVQRYGAPEIWE